MEINVLNVLDQMDEIRRNHYFDKPQNADLLARMLEAVLAKAAGYKSRTDWTTALKAYPSAYKRDIEKTENVVTF